MNTLNKQQQATGTSAFNKLSRVLLTTLILAFVTACASAPSSTNTVDSRAQARWDALIARDYAATYEYYSPGYRSAHSQADLEIDLRSRRVAWTSAKVLKSSCEANVCTVESEVGYKVARPVPGLDEWDNKKQLPEKWVRIEGQWWFSPN